MSESVSGSVRLSVTGSGSLSVSESVRPRIVRGESREGRRGGEGEASRSRSHFFHPPAHTPAHTSPHTVLL